MQQGLRGCSKCPRAPPPRVLWGQWPWCVTEKVSPGTVPPKGVSPGAVPQGDVPRVCCPHAAMGGPRPPPSTVPINLSSLNCRCSAAGFLPLCPRPAPQPPAPGKGTQPDPGGPAGCWRVPTISQGGCLCFVPGSRVSHDVLGGSLAALGVSCDAPPGPRWAGLVHTGISRDGARAAPALPTTTLHPPIPIAAKQPQTPPQHGGGPVPQPHRLCPYPRVRASVSPAPRRVRGRACLRRPH